MTRDLLSGSTYARYVYMLVALAAVAATATTFAAMLVASQSSLPAVKPLGPGDTVPVLRPVNCACQPNFIGLIRKPEDAA